MFNQEVLIDASYLGYTSHTAKTKIVDGKEVQAIVGVMDYLREIKYNNPNSSISMIFDGYPRFRYDIFPEYKKQRKINPEQKEISSGYKRQERIIKMICPMLGVNTYYHPDTESDDIAAYLARRSELDRVVLITGDSDWLQLISDKIVVDYRGTIYNKEKFVEDFGYMPVDIARKKAMCGDSSDSIPPIGSFGEKYATEFIKKYFDIDDFMFDMKEVDINDQPKRFQNLYSSQEMKDNYERNYALINLNHDHDIDWSKLEFTIGRFNREKIQKAVETFNHIPAMKSFDMWVKPFE